MISYLKKKKVIFFYIFAFLGKQKYHGCKENLYKDSSSDFNMGFLSKCQT